MAARNTTLSLAADTWTLVTDNNVSGALVFQNAGEHPIRIMVLTSTTLPAAGVIAGSLVYGPGQGEFGRTLAALAPGLTAPVRLAALSQMVPGRLQISHAAT
jgi:hypothetical protein